MSLVIAEQLDTLQKQYLTSTNSNVPAQINLNASHTQHSELNFNPAQSRTMFGHQSGRNQQLAVDSQVVLSASGQSLQAN